MAEISAAVPPPRAVGRPGLCRSMRRKWKGGSPTGLFPSSTFNQGEKLEPVAAVQAKEVRVCSNSRCTQQHDPEVVNVPLAEAIA